MASWKKSKVKFNVSVYLIQCRQSLIRMRLVKVRHGELSWRVDRCHLKTFFDSHDQA